MAEHMHNVTFKPNGDPLVTVHADTEFEFEAALAYVQSKAELIAQTSVAVDAAFNAARQLGATTISEQPAQAAPAQPVPPAPWDQPQQPAPQFAQPAPSNVVPMQQPAPQPQYAPPAAAPAAGLPPSVTIYEGQNPNPGKEQYTELFVNLPYIQDATARTHFNGQLKSQFWAKFDGNSKAWYMNRKHRPALEALIAQNAGLFQ